MSSLPSAFMRLARWACLSIGFVGASGVHMANAQPYLPSRDDEVLERLPDAAGTATLQRLRWQLDQRPGDLDAALYLARELIEQARRSGDPRYLGRAEAVLARGSQLTDPPPQVRVLRAILHQANHDFLPALAELDAALADDPSAAQAWLTRASIHQVRGDYGPARDDCRRLARLRQDTLAQICLAQIAALNGRAATAYRLLQGLAEGADRPAVTRGTTTLNTAVPTGWIDGLLADIAERRGDHAAAERHYRAAVRAGNADLYVLLGYADFLLDRNRPAEVGPLLQAHRAADGALLRLALAAQRNADAGAAHAREELRARFAAARARGGNPHLREEARFTLSLLHDAQAALPLAVANWALQREPVDTLLLLETAVAARQPQAARAALTWLAQTRLEDVRLHALVQALRSNAP